MQQGNLFNNKKFGMGNGRLGFDVPRKTIVGIILLTALVAFEIFNFDTTRFALNNLLGGVSFWGIAWASILALAFCAIDFAGLARLFTPEQGADEPKAVWYLMGAWLLGATMNAIMTWWAVSLTLLSHDLGNEVLSRSQLLQFAPIFVAVLVWLTRILFIGALSVTGEHMFDLAQPRLAQTPPRKQAQPTQAAVHVTRPSTQKPQVTRTNRRIRQQPPIPGGMRHTPAGMHAQSRRKQ